MIKDREQHFDTIGRSMIAGMFLGAAVVSWLKYVQLWWAFGFLGVVLLVREMWSVE